MSCGILCLCEFIIVLGQLNAYVGYYKKNEMIEGDNPPVGILLCTDKGSQMVEYAYLEWITSYLFQRICYICLTRRNSKNLC